MAHQVFERPVPIHFGDCDPAGIVYHPSYYRLLNELHEDFLHEVAGVGFIEIRRYGVGFPVVGVRTDFAAPSRPGDVLDGRVWVERMGRTSIRFALTLGEDRLRRGAAPVLRRDDGLRAARREGRVREDPDPRGAPGRVRALPALGGRARA